MSTDTPTVTSSKKTFALVVGFSIVSAAAGAVVSHFVTKKMVEERGLEDFDQKLVSEIKATIEHIRDEGLDLSTIVISDNLDEPMIQVSNEDAKMVETDEGLDILVPEVEAEEETVEEIEREIVPSSFTKALEKPSLEDLAARNQKTAYHKIIADSVYAATEELEIEEPPYEDPDISVISKDLFVSNVSEYGQMELTYFADGGVIDEMNEIVENSADLIGTDPPFGEKSEQENVVYIRNKKRKEEYAVISDPGNASDFLRPQLQHVDGGETLQHSLQALRSHWNGPERT